jgi:lysophospholipase L1-like esterase
MGRPEPNETERARTQDFPPPEAREDGIFMDLAAETPQMTRILARTEQALAKLRDLAAPAPVVVLVIPSWRSVFPGEFEAAAARLGAAAPRPAGESQEYLRGLCARRIVEMCGKRLRIAAVDLTEPLRGRSDLYLPQVKHWNPAGHRFVAERLAPVVAPLLAR